MLQVSSTSAVSPWRPHNATPQAAPLIPVLVTTLLAVPFLGITAREASSQPTSSAPLDSIVRVFRASASTDPAAPDDPAVLAAREAASSAVRSGKNGSELVDALEAELSTSYSVTRVEADNDYWWEWIPGHGWIRICSEDDNLELTTATDHDPIVVWVATPVEY